MILNHENRIHTDFKVQLSISTTELNLSMIYCKGKQFDSIIEAYLLVLEKYPKLAKKSLNSKLHYPKKSQQHFEFHQRDISFMEKYHQITKELHKIFLMIENF